MKLNIKPKILTLIVSSLITGATLASGVMKSDKSYFKSEAQQLSIENSNSEQKIAIALDAVVVTIAEEGAVYVSKIKNEYNFWVLDAQLAKLILVAQATIDDPSTQVLEVNLSNNTTAVFYSDNLIVDTNSAAVIFNGNLVDGKIAMPMDSGYFLPLADALTSVGQSIAIDQQTPELLTILDTQKDIFVVSDSVKPLIDADVENFKNKAIDSVMTFKQQAESNQQYGEGLLADYENITLGYQQQFLNQLDIDLATLQGVSNDLSANIDEQINHYTRNVIPCIEGAEVKMNADVTTLVTILDTENESEDLDENAENLIEATELETDRQGLTMEQCVGGLVTLENYSSTNIIAETPYLAINTSAEPLEARVDSEVALWSADMQLEADNLALAINTDELVERTLAYETIFDRWISPKYLIERNLEKPTKDIFEKSLFNKLSDEKLCDDETFNISFNLLGIVVILGTPFDDTIVAGNQNNLILSFSGDDCIESHAGYDLILSGTGNDKIYAGDDHDIVHAGKGNDEIHGSAGNNYTFPAGAVTIGISIGNLLMGGADNDRIFGGEVNADKGEDGSIDNHGYTDIILGDSFLFGGSAGDDTIMGEMGIDFLFGQAGNDTISNVTPGVISIDGINIKFGSYFFGQSGNDNITGSNTPLLLGVIGDFAFGNDGIDTINLGDGLDFGFGNKDNDTVNGQDGTDFVFGNSGNDNISGGKGTDLVSGDSGDDTAHGSAGIFDLVLGGRGNDRLFGDEGIDLIFGSQDVDIINGNQSFDLIFGGAARDVIHGDDGIDILFGNSGVDMVYGDKGMDLIFGNSDSDTLFGGDDTDVMFGNANTSKESIETLWGGNGIDIMFGNSGIDKMYGEANADLMFGNSDDDQMFGGTGLDIMFGNTGHDYIDGQNDIDIIFGNEGNDVILGGAGSDLAFGNSGCDNLSGGDNTDLLFGNSNNDQISGGNSTDILFGNTGADEVRGNAGKDVLFGNAGNDYVNGDSDLDVMFGNDGNDHMLGGSSKDVMFGNSGSDYINGNSGSDVMFGNSENDIMDGDSGNDLIFGNTGDDRINSGDGTDTTFGNRGADRLRSVEGKNFAFGNRDNDTLDGYWSSGFDSRDRMWGNSNNDNITGNKSNNRDRRYGGSGSDSKHWNLTLINASEFNVNWTTPTCDVQ